MVFNLNSLKLHITKSGEVNYSTSPLVFYLVLPKCDSPIQNSYYAFNLSDSAALTSA